MLISKELKKFNPGETSGSKFSVQRMCIKESPCNKTHEVWG